MKDIATAGSDITIEDITNTPDNIDMKDIAVERISPV
jgi:hypothetical protein